MVSFVFVSLKYILLSSLLLPSEAFAPQSNLLNRKVSESSTSLAGVGKVVNRIKDSLLSKERSREDLKIGIAGFYDRSSQIWEEGAFILMDF